jgi:hypothetical protein
MSKSTPADHSLATLTAVHKSITAAAASLLVEIESMKEHGLEKIVVDVGQAEMDRGLKGLGVFTKYVAAAIHAARVERGDFGTPVGVPLPMKKSPAVKKHRKSG